MLVDCWTANDGWYEKMHWHYIVFLTYLLRLSQAYSLSNQMYHFWRWEKKYLILHQYELKWIRPEFQTTPGLLIIGSKISSTEWQLLGVRLYIDNEVENYALYFEIKVLYCGLHKLSLWNNKATPEWRVFQSAH